MRDLIVYFQDTVEAEDLQSIQDKAGGPYPRPPTHIGETFARMGVTTELAQTLRYSNGNPVGWVNHERDIAPAIDYSDPEHPKETVGANLDLSSLSLPTEVEVPDPVERAKEAAAVTARLNKLSAAERATVARALAKA